MTDFEQHDDDIDYKSKSQLKREVEALQKLGESLLELPDAIYKSFPIPEDLDAALQDAKRIKSNVAKKRQMQFIGKVMRDIDAEPIQQAYEEWKTGRKKMAREFHKLEQLRDDLIAGENDALQTLITEHPSVDIQQLRQLIRGAQQEKKNNKPPKNFRKLFQLLKELHDV